MGTTRAKNSVAFLLRPLPAFETPAAPYIGEQLPDGTVYAGLSPDSGRPLYARPADAPLKMTFNAAAEQAKFLDAHGHRDWRLPSQAELELLNRHAHLGALKDSFDTAGGWYWSAEVFTAFRSFRHGRKFSDGTAGYLCQDHRHLARFVRG